MMTSHEGLNVITWSDPNHAVTLRSLLKTTMRPLVALICVSLGLSQTSGQWCS